MKRFKNGKSWFVIGIGLFLSITGVLAQQFLAYRTQTQAQVETLTSVPQTSEADAEDESKKAAEELVQIRQAYQKAGLITCVLQYELKSPEPTRPLESMTGQMTLQGKDSHFKMEQMEYIQQEGKLLCIDHEEKKMLLDLNNKRAQNAFNLAQITTLFEESGANALVETVDPTQKKLDLDIASSRMEHLQIWYQTASHWLDKAQMSLPNAETGVSDTLTVHFKEQKVSKGALPVDMKPFVLLKNKVYTTTHAFKSYKLNILK